MSQRVPEFTAKYKVDNVFFENERLPRESEEYEELFGFWETCSLEHIAVRFNSADILVKLEIDGLIVLELDVYELNKYQRDDFYLGHGVYYDSGRRIFIFSPSSPIQCKRYFSFHAKANYNTTSKKYYGHIVNYQHWS